VPERAVTGAAAAPVVVIGVGNRLRADDAAGLEVARRVAPLAGDAVSVREAGGDPAALMDAWAGAELAIVVDAIAAGGAPGDVVRLDATAAPLPARLFGTSTHAIGVGEAVELARALGRLPKRIVVYGVEGAGFGTGERMSPAVEGALGALARRVATEARAAGERSGGGR